MHDVASGSAAAACACRRGGWSNRRLARRRRGFLTVLTARLIPLVPFSLFNYAAGVTGVSLRAYAPATLLGIVPGTVAYTTLGGSLHHPASAPFLASITVIVLLTAVVILRERRQRRVARQTGEAPPPVPVAS